MKGGDDSIIIIGGGGMGGGGGGGPIIMEGGGKKDKKDGNTIIILPQQQQKQSSYMSPMSMMHPAPQMMPNYAPPSMGYGKDIVPSLSFSLSLSHSDTTHSVTFDHFLQT